MKQLLVPTLFSMSLILGACASTASHTPVNARAASAQCNVPNLQADVAAIYQGGAISNVEPVHRREIVARALQFDRVIGARFDVPAPRDMNAGYAERVLSCHAASNAAGAHDPLGVAGIRDVDVRMVGPRMRIKVVAEDQTAGRAILERAEAMARGQVTVQQVAAADAGQVAF